MKHVGIATLLGALLAPGAVQAQIEGVLGGDEGTPFTAPNRSFSVTIPPAWGASLVPGDPNTVEFRALQKPGHGNLYIRRISVPSGASPKQLLLNAVENRLSKLPSFQLNQKRTLSLAGVPAAAVVGSYDFHGNAQYPRILEEVFIVVGPDAYIFHFECASPVGAAYAPDLTIFYQSFQPRSAPVSGPFAVEGEEQPVDDSVLPF